MAMLCNSTVPGLSALYRKEHFCVTTPGNSKRSPRRSVRPTVASLNQSQTSATLPEMCNMSRAPTTPGSEAGSSSSSNDQQTTGLQWVMITDPRQSRDKDTMRKVRTHVMNNYLLNEQRNPNSTDIRVRRQRSGRRGRPSTKTSQAPESRAESESSEASVRSGSPYHRDSVIDFIMPPKATTQENMSVESIEDAEVSAATAAYIASGIGLFGIGTMGDVFNVMPRFDDEHIDVRMLKHTCTTYFANRAMCKRWSPMLFSARPAFLSTLCLSSAYLDLMEMDFSRAKTSRSIESVRTLMVRDQTVKLISQSLSNPETRCNDATIVAVLQLLYGEMIVADDQHLQWHEQGLNTMVRHRGGLDRLGGEGLLAAILTIEVFALSIVRETSPRQEYLDHTRTISSLSQSRGRASASPESPLYHPSGLFHSLAYSGCCSDATMEIINLVRNLTQTVLELRKTMPVSSPDVFGPNPAIRIYTQQEIYALMRKREETIQTVLAQRPGSDHVYEATRLCGVLYATAIRHNTPFSKTANNFTSQQGISITTLIRNHLSCTNLSYCWDSMVGTLFWITLVTSAACNTAMTTNADAEMLATRKWTVAMAIRCSVLLSFRHTNAVAKMLKTLLAVQDGLRGEGTLEFGDI